ncbi:MAG: hypothetical protein IPM29_12560 [Planctomycetes bacterium]|nr:hypothetical protein [Planctomycetota bacterium]
MDGPRGAGNMDDAMAERMARPRPRTRARRGRRRRGAAVLALLVLALLAWLGVGPGAGPAEVPRGRGEPGPGGVAGPDRPGAGDAPEPRQPLVDLAAAPAPAGGAAQAAVGAPVAAAAQAAAAEPAPAPAADRWRGVIADRLPACLDLLRTVGDVGALERAWQSADELAAMPLAAAERSELESARGAASVWLCTRLAAMCAAAQRGEVLGDRAGWRALAGLRVASLVERTAALAREVGIAAVPCGPLAAVVVAGVPPGELARGAGLRVLDGGELVRGALLRGLDGRFAVRVVDARGAVRVPVVPRLDVEPIEPDAAFAAGQCAAAVAAGARGLAVAWLTAAEALGAEPTALDALRVALAAGR